MSNTVLRLVLTLVVIVMPLNAYTKDRKSITEYIPKEELLGAHHLVLLAPTNAIRVLSAAINELENYALKASSFKTVAIHTTGNSYHVLFSNTEVGSTMKGSEGHPRPVLVRVDQTNFRVLGSYQYE